MRSLKSLWLMVAVSGLMTMVGSRSFAGPLLPPLIPGVPIAGETAMISVADNVSLVGRVDWIVLPPGSYGGTVFAPLVSSIFGVGVTTSPTYIYAYQIEATMSDLEDLTVNVAGPYIGAAQSFLDLDDLDGDGTPDAHDVTSFPNLGPTIPPPETEFTTQLPLQLVTSGLILKPDNITWDFGGFLDAGEESEVLWTISDMPPTYGISFLSDGLPSPGKGLLPVPSPEPAAVVLLMMGVLGLGIVSRCRRKA